MARQTPPPYYLRASVDSSAQLGQRVDVYIRGKQARTVHDCGALRFRGKVHFAAGEWCGVELDQDQAWGRNDGSVEGVRYFRCDQRRGVFVRAHRCKPAKQQAHRESRSAGVTPTREADEVLGHVSTPISADASRNSGFGASPFDAVLSFSPDSSRSLARSDADVRFDALIAEYSSTGSFLSNADLEPWQLQENPEQQGEYLEQSMELFERLGRALAVQSHAQSMQNQNRTPGAN